VASFDQRAGSTFDHRRPSLLVLVCLLVLVWLLLLSSVSILSFAQTTTSGALGGVVTDRSGAVVPNADVEIKDNAKGTTQSTKTDHLGVYRFFFLPPARYTLTVTLVGFRTESRAVNVLLGPPVSVNVTLQVAQATASVSVLAEAPLVNAENGDVSTTMNAQQVSEVPNPGNDLTYIAQTAPGAIMNTDGIGFGGLGNFSILGMPGTSNLFNLNGMNDNNIQYNVNNSGVTGMMLGQNEVQEATIVSNGYSGQFGGAAGASVNYLTKSGSNRFHGNAQYYWNGSTLNANDWIDNAVGNPRPFDVAHQWAGSLGGTIKKDKLFFFLNSEGIRIILPYSFQVVVPSPEFESATLANIDSKFGSTSASDAFYHQMFNLYNGAPGASAATLGNFNPGDLGCYGWTGPQVQGRGLGTTDYCSVHFSRNGNAPSSDSIVSGKVDWNAGASDRVFLFVQYGQGQNPAYVDAISPVFNVFSNHSTWQGQLGETHTIGPTAANQFLLAGTFIDGTSGLRNSALAQATFPTELSWYNSGIPFALLGGFDVAFAFPGGGKTTTYQISDDLVKTRGKHKFEVGVNLLRTLETLGGYNSYGSGLLLPLSMSAFFDGGVDPNNPSADFTLLQQAYPLITWNRFAFYSLGLYGQEEWHARSNLTLTLALRADHQSNPVCENRCFVRLSGPLNSISHDPDQPYDSAFLIHQKQAFQNTDSLVWSPRFSFAWQPRGVAHNTVIRGGVGIFYDPVAAAPATGLSFNPPLINTFFVSGGNLAPGETNSLSQNASKSNAEFLKAFATGQTLAQIKAADPSFTPPILSNPPSVVHSPQVQKWSLQLQQGFGAATFLTIGYFGNHGIHELAQNPDANAFGFGSFQNAVCTSPLVPPCADPRFGEVNEFETNAVSNYNGMVVSFEHRITRWGSGVFQVNYTYGHALDEVSNGGVGYFTTGGSIYPQDATNLRGSYGAAEYDARHSLTGNYVWEVPLKEALGGHGPDFLVKGWQISGTILARTGNPYTITDPVEAGNLSQNNFFGTIYSVPVAPLGPAGPCGKGAVTPAVPLPCQPPQVLDGSPNRGALFVQAGCETGFNTGHLGASGVCDGPLVTFAQGRNRFYGPGYFNTDFAIMKNTKIHHWEHGMLGISAQFFNFFNHANFGFPDPLSSDSNFGQILNMEQSPTSILGSTLQANVARRMIQLRVQLKF
jgi:Carboxypeptidase regulatory-like domain